MTKAKFERIEQLNEYLDALALGEKVETGTPDPTIRSTVELLHALDDAPAPDPAFVQRLWQEMMEGAAASERPNRSKAAAVRSKPNRHIQASIGRRPLAGLAAAVSIVLMLGIYFATMRPASVSAEEIVRRAQEAAASPVAGGITSFMSTERTVSRVGNARMNTSAGQVDAEEIHSETKRWYVAPNHWRIESNGTAVDSQGKEISDRKWQRLAISDGSSVWQYDIIANEATINEINPSAGDSSFGGQSPLGRGMVNIQAVLQRSNPNVRWKLQGEEIVAGRNTYVLSFPEETRSASAQEMNGPGTVWVDKESYFVLKVVQYSGVDGKPLSTTEVTSIQYNVTIDPALFTFTPSQGAKVDDRRPKPAPTKEQFTRQIEDLARRADFPLFVPSQVPDGLVPRQPRMDSAMGLELEYALPAEADKGSHAAMRIVQQKATYDLVARWAEGAESATIGNAKGWLRRGFRSLDGTGMDSAAMLLQDGTMISVSSFSISLEVLIDVAASLVPVPGGHAPLPNPSVPVHAGRPTPTPVPAPSFTILRPTWLPEQMAVREQYEPDPNGNGSMVVLGFDPRPDDQQPHDVLTLREMVKGSAPSEGRPDPEETHEIISGRDVRVISREENWITLTWVQGDLVLTLTNAYDPPGHPRYTPEQLRKIVESIR